ncbi:MAG: hypothetical protein ACPGU4_00645 [Flavobacteriales bacterium]
MKRFIFSFTFLLGLSATGYAQDNAVQNSSFDGDKFEPSKVLLSRSEYKTSKKAELSAKDDGEKGATNTNSASRFDIRFKQTPKTEKSNHTNTSSNIKEGKSRLDQVDKRSTQTKKELTTKSKKSNQSK